MANFAGDFSSMYGCTATLFATSTGVSTSANLSGSSVDLASNAANIVSAILVCGNAAGTTPTMDAKIQESTDGSSNWTDVTGGAQTTLPGDTDDNKFLIWNRKNVSGAARYYRVVLTTSAAANTVINEVYYLRSKGEYAPLSTNANVLAVNNT